MNVRQPSYNGARAWESRRPSTNCVVRHSLRPVSRLACWGIPSSEVIACGALLETASAPIVQAANEQPPCLNFTDVNRHNFKAVLPIMRSAIQEATFVAIDAEFTGLFPEGVSEDPLDDYEERYKRLLASADNFVICQFGLSAFKWHAAPGAARGGHWEAKTFNAYIFPRPDDKAGWDKRFLCQASSLAYLAEQGFDFNKMIHDGIGFIPLAARDAKVRGLREELDKTQRSREVRGPEEEALVESTRARALSWLLSAEPELVLPLPPTRRLRTLMRLLLQEEFQMPSLGYDPFSIEFCSRSGSAGGVDDGDGDGGSDAVAGGVAAADQEGEVEEVERVVGGSSSSSSSDGGSCVSNGEGEAAAATSGEDGEEFMRLQRLDQWRPGSLIASGQQLTPRQRIEMLVEQSGFSQVLDILRDAGRPLVGHNASLDLAYTLAQFHGALPRNWRAYKALLQRAFPGGLYDTKHIATQLIATGAPVGDSGLANLYRTLMDEQWLRAYVPGGGLPAALGGGVPEIRHAQGFTGYVGTSVEKAHEAGFDAFMTGAAFTRLLRFIVAKAAMQSGGSAADSGCGSSAAAAAADIAVSVSSINDAETVLQPLGPYRGRVHIMRSDLPYADMYGNDPMPSRPAVLYVAGFGMQTRPPFLLQRFGSLGFNPVHVSMLTAPNGGAIGALVQLARAELVPRAMQAVRKRWSNWTVMTFAEYYQNRLQQQQQEAGAGPPGTAGSSGTGPSGTGSSVGRTAPRMIRTNLGASSAQGAAEGSAGSAAGGGGGRVQLRGEGGAAAAAAARVDGSSASAASSEARKQASGQVMNERQRLQALTQMVPAARSSGAAASRSAEVAEAAPAASSASTVAGAPGQERDGASMVRALESRGAATGERDSGDGDSLGALASATVSPEAGPASTSRDLGGTGAGAGGEAATASPIDDVGSAADAEAAKRAAERLRSLALAAQRLKSWPLKDEPKGGAADGGGGGLALQRPGRPTR